MIIVNILLDFMKFNNFGYLQLQLLSFYLSLITNNTTIVICNPPIHTTSTCTTTNTTTSTITSATSTFTTMNPSTLKKLNYNYD